MCLFSPKKLVIAAFLAVTLTFSLPQLGKIDSLSFLPSSQVEAQSEKGFFSRFLAPIRNFFSRQDETGSRGGPANPSTPLRLEGNIVGEPVVPGGVLNKDGKTVDWDKAYRLAGQDWPGRRVDLRLELAPTDMAVEGGGLVKEGNHWLGVYTASTDELLGNVAIECWNRWVENRRSVEGDCEEGILKIKTYETPDRNGEEGEVEFIGYFADGEVFGRIGGGDYEVPNSPLATEYEFKFPLSLDPTDPDSPGLYGSGIYLIKGRLQIAGRGEWRDIGNFRVDCPLQSSTITVTKTVDEEPGENWEFTAEMTNSVSGAVIKDPSFGTTNADGKIDFEVDYSLDQTSATAQVTETPTSGYQLINAYCESEGVRVGTPNLTEYKVENIPTVAGGIINCRFDNTQKQTVIKVDKYLDDIKETASFPGSDWEITAVVADGDGSGTETVPAFFNIKPNLANFASTSVNLSENLQEMGPSYEFVSAGCEYASNGQTVPVTISLGGNPTIELAIEDNPPDDHLEINCRFDNKRRLMTVYVEKYIQGEEGLAAGWEIEMEAIDSTPPTVEKINPEYPQTTGGGSPIGWTVLPQPGQIAKVVLTEQIKTRYEFDNFTCFYPNDLSANPDPNNAPNFSVENDENEAWATIDIDPAIFGLHQSMICRFFNKRQPTVITVEKYVDNQNSPSADWTISASSLGGSVSPSSGKTTNDPNSPLVFEAYPNLGTTAEITLTETLKQNYYKFDRAECRYQNGDSITTANKPMGIEMLIPYNDTIPNHEIINCNFFNDTIPSRIGNLKLSLDYKDCVASAPTSPIDTQRIVSGTNTRALRHTEISLNNTNWLEWGLNDDSGSSGWSAAESVWDDGGVWYEAWTDTGYTPDGSPPIYNCNGCGWPFMAHVGPNDPKVIQKTATINQEAGKQDFFRQKFTIPAGRKIVSAKLYFASDNLIKVWLKKSDQSAVQLVGIGENLDNYLSYTQDDPNDPNDSGYESEDIAYDEQGEGGIFYRKLNLTPGDYVLGINLLNWQPFPLQTNYQGPHPMGIQFMLHLETKPEPEFCNARDDNNDSACADDNCCQQDPNTHAVTCDQGVDEGWKYELKQGNVINLDKAVLYNGRPRNITAAMGGNLLPISTNSTTYYIEAEWKNVLKELPQFPQRNCNAQDASKDNPNNSPFCHTYNINLNFNMELHARRLLVQARNISGSSVNWVNVGSCTHGIEDQYSCNLNEIFLVDPFGPNNVPDLFQNTIVLKFILEPRAIMANSAQSSSFQNGDANGDGKINSLDYAIWLESSEKKDQTADFNGDGATNDLDYINWWKNYEK